jgi:hypothetical protein
MSEGGGASDSASPAPTAATLAKIVSDYEIRLEQQKETYERLLGMAMDQMAGSSSSNNNNNSNNKLLIEMQYLQMIRGDLVTLEDDVEKRKKEKVEMVRLIEQQEKLIDDQEKASTDQEKVLADQEKLIADQERQLTRLGSMHESIVQRVVKRAEKAENEVKRLERRDTQDDDEPSDNEEADDIKTGTRGGSKQVPDPDGKCQVVGGDYQSAGDLRSSRPRRIPKA